MHQRRTVRRDLIFMVKRCVSLKFISKSSQYRNNARPKRCVYERIEKFKSDPTRVDLWKHSGSLLKKKFKIQRSAGKLCLPLFGLKRAYSGRLRRKNLKHSAYSTDLAPFDYYLFGTLKDALRSRQFSSDKAVLKTVP